VFKILALDGGGLRSVFQARLIERIESAIGGKLSADLWAGTSGGAIVASSLQVLSASDTIKFFQTEGPKIFTDDGFLDDVRDLWDLKGARYETKRLRKVLEKTFGGMTLGEVKAKILITSFALQSAEGWEPVVFHNFTGPKGSPSMTITDAVCASSAAPTYFPVYPINGNKYADGGLWGNNPSMSAVSAACDKMVGRQRIDKVSVLSIGTGKNPMTLKGAKNDLGALDWLSKGLIDILLDGNIEASHYYSRSLLGPQYLRVQPSLANEIKLDDTDGIQRMIDVANGTDLDPILSWMQGFWV
jgi:patatin-like phospholipase/acyl hydrolase